MKASKITPLMQQYLQIKSLHQDKIVLFRMGDFFEMFHKDAERAAPILNITLTSRNKKAADETKMCGVPHHSVAGPIAKLLSAGFKVAICDQVEPASQSKGLVRREVTRVLSPGMVYDPSTLDQMSSNYLCAFDKDTISFLDISTGEAFYYHISHPQDVFPLLALLNPSELVLTPHQKQTAGFKGFHISVFSDSKNPEAHVLPQEGVLLPGSACFLLKYVKAQAGEPSAKIVQEFQKRDLHQEMYFAPQSVSHLELLKTYTGEKKGSLFAAVNRTKTPAGARLLKSRLCRPSTNQKLLQARLDQVEYWISHPDKMSLARSHLSRLGDMQRRLGKVTGPGCDLRDILMVAHSLAVGLKVLPLCPPAVLSSEVFSSAQKVYSLVSSFFSEGMGTTAEAVQISIKKGSHPEWDKLVQRKKNLQSELHRFEQQERVKNSIPSLKVRYNNVFGYYIEITKIHIKKVPSHYTRKQTLTQAERYTTTELNRLEGAINEVDMHLNLEKKKILNSLKKEVINHFPDLFALCRVLSEMDVYLSWAIMSVERNYCRPQFSTKGQMVLVHSRHPVVEQQSPDLFVPNTLRMKSGECLLLTGPNMAGKSTLMRQVALSVILAQAGGFVPAEKALLPVFKKLFTRIGASDSLSEGLSTFMVEMKESAEILKKADTDSLVILDEIGRGTATYDGMSLAQGILEYLVQRKTGLVFFATHYHELTQIPLPRIRNAHLSVKEEGGMVVKFLYELKPGSAQSSYGIYVAKLAHFPQEVIKRASQLLKQREQNRQREQAWPVSFSKKTEPLPDLVPDSKTQVVGKTSPLSSQLSFKESTKNQREMESQLLKQIRSYPLQNRSPLETMNAVAAWKKEIKGSDENNAPP